MLFRQNNNNTSSTRRRPEGRTACIIHVETHTVLIVCFAINVFWFYYLATTTSISTSSLNHGLESVVSHQESTATGSKDKNKEQPMFAFTMRDSRRLVPVEPPLGIHIYDYVDIYNADQTLNAKTALFLDGRYIVEAPCRKFLKKYSLECYKEKLIQVFEHVLMKEAHAKTNYFFYMESDNTLCLPLDQIQELALRQARYFIATGVGASGWIMRRDFMVDFLDRYKALGNSMKIRNPMDQSNRMPDLVASWMLMEQNQWAVTNRYLVSHTILNGKGENALTQQQPGNKKHLPRCLEPHRGKWGKDKDQFGWDYFDYTKCPDAEVYPCHADDEVASTRPPAKIRNDPVPVVIVGKDGKKQTIFNYGIPVGGEQQKTEPLVNKTDTSTNTNKAALSHAVSLQVQNT
ncbi:expressed unknown protein [Seminavis robusta]|uniref:Uncharacterized protein n=1 Tax=Seminavis robusta TaxID=568900 RepID=A0A9N8ED37_9STRA|nr:expressed unknown protein [Seminavis robusta]|eukprot:Sro819_g207090.1 n/a (404) ;mRNA; f:20603-21814